MIHSRVRTEWHTIAGQRTRLRLTDASQKMLSPLVLLHGLGCSSSAWLPSLRVFAQRAPSQQIIAPDFPGCGRSGCATSAMDIQQMADWTAELLDALGIEQAYIGGNSLGGQIALMLARRHSRRVGALVLLGPTTGNSQVSFWRYVVGLLRDGFGESLSYNLYLLWMYSQMGLRRYLATVRAMMHDDPLAHASEIRCPALVLRGGHDRIISENMARDLANALPRGQYQPLDSTAHAAEYNTPDLFVNATLEFLERVAQEGQPEVSSIKIAGS